jgi:hypothetical protein
MSTCLVDAHVHFHACYDLETFLDGALRNFQQGAVGSAWSGCLLLTEARDARWFRRWRDSRERAGAWRFEPTWEEESLYAVRETGERLVIVAGRQIVCREGLEILALGRDLELPDGLPIGETLEKVRESSALPVLPWGFGKWWGRRGAAVAGALRQGRELFLGDNSGRLRHGPPPRLFRQARELGIPVLPGSDPLPFPRHAGRAGSYGFMLLGPTEEHTPTQDLLRRIRAAGQPRSFGRRADLPRFLRDQMEMQLS